MFEEGITKKKWLFLCHLKDIYHLLKIQKISERPPGNHEYEVKFFRVKIRRNKYYQNIHPCLNSSPAVGAAISNEYK